MKLALIWLLLTAMTSIFVVYRAPSILPVGKSTAHAIKLSSELQLLKQLISLETINKQALQNKYMQLHKNYKPSVISFQIESLPAAILSSILIGINVLNMLVVLWLWIKPYSKTKPSDAKNSAADL